MKQVDKKTFYDSFQNLPNVSTAAVGDFPFEWHVKQSYQLIAKSVDRIRGEDERGLYGYRLFHNRETLNPERYEN